ncbi:MAG: hypothetical protein IKZ00_07490, partial [Bacteroidaceae bacterium]|nr:hypothetical protein [Bacteroidaceae bacterium]
MAQTDIFSVQFLHGSAVHVPLQQQTGREGVTKESEQGPVMARCEMLKHQPNAKNVILNTQRHPELVSGSVRGEGQEKARCEML